MSSMKELLDEMESLTRAAGSQPTPTGIPRVLMIRGEVLSSQLVALYEPMIGVVLQGTKTLKIGDQVLRCQAPSYFVLPVELPVMGMVHQGEAGAPYLSVGLTLDRERVAELLRDLPPDPGLERSPQDFVVCAAGEEFLSALLRLLRLMKSPKDIPALAPAYEREILYRVIQGPQGWMLRDLAKLGSSLSRIETTASWIKEHLAEPISVDFLARQAGMSNTAYHRHFRAATGMSPIQFQKHLRLHRARSLLVVGAPTVATVAYEVGYQSASQFNREYAKLFGRSPRQGRAPAATGGRARGILPLVWCPQNSWGLDLAVLASSRSTPVLDVLTSTPALLAFPRLCQNDDLQRPERHKHRFARHRKYLSAVFRKNLHGSDPVNPVILSLSLIPRNFWDTTLGVDDVHGLEERLAQLWCTRDHAVAANQAFLGQEVVRPSSRLLHQKHSGGGVPGVDVQFAVAVLAARGHISKTQRAGAAAFDPGSQIVQPRRDLVILFKRRPGRPPQLDDALTRVLDVAHTNRLPIQGGSAAPAGRKEFAGHGIKDDSNLGKPLRKKRDGDAEPGDSPGKVGRAVNRINDPGAATVRSASFLTEKAVFGKSFGQPCGNEFFHLGVGFGQIVLGPLEGELEVLVAFEKPPSNQASRFLGDRGGHHQAKLHRVVDIHQISSRLRF